MRVKKNENCKKNCFFDKKRCKIDGGFVREE
jgi:hypothetical protein